MSRAPTLAAIRAELAEKAPGIVIRKTESGEYRVTFAQVAIAAAFPALSLASHDGKWPAHCYAPAADA